MILHGDLQRQGRRKSGDRWLQRAPPTPWRRRGSPLPARSAARRRRRRGALGTSRRVVAQAQYVPVRGQPVLRQRAGGADDEAVLAAAIRLRLLWLVGAEFQRRGVRTAAADDDEAASLAGLREQSFQGMIMGRHRPTAYQLAVRVSSEDSASLVQSHKEHVQDACSSATRSRSVPDSPSAAKKPRIATPSSMPTFKVCTALACLRPACDAIDRKRLYHLPPSFLRTSFVFQLNLQFRLDNRYMYSR